MFRERPDISSQISLAAKSHSNIQPNKDRGGSSGGGPSVAMVEFATDEAGAQFRKLRRSSLAKLMTVLLKPSVQPNRLELVKKKMMKRIGFILCLFYFHYKYYVYILNI